LFVRSPADNLLRDVGLDTVLAHVAEGITVQDPSGRLIYANPAALHMIGFESFDELLATPTDQVVGRFELFHPDGSSMQPSELPSRAALAGERASSALIRFRVVASGEERYATVQSEPILDPDGSLLFAVNTFHDMTDATQTEGSLRFLAEAGALLSSSLDYRETLRRVARMAVPALADWCAVDVGEADGQVRRVAIYHADPTKLAVAEELRRRFPPDPDTPHGVHHVLRTGSSVIVEEVSEAQISESHDARRYGEEWLRLVRGLGLRSYIVAPMMSGARVIGALTLVAAESGRRYRAHDLAVAELLGVRAGLAIENSRLYREAEQAIKARDRFVAVAAHELLTPVTIVRGYSQALQRLVQRAASESADGESVTLEASRLLRSVQRVDVAGDRLTRLIADLLDVSRLERGSLAAEPRPMNLSALVASVVDGLRVQQAEGRYQRDLELTVDLPRDGDVSGTWDPTRLEQVLFNVLDNAMKYSLANGRIRLRLRVEHGEAQITVSDQGLGIEADELEAIFEPFYRASHANQQAAGFGMGLAVCREIVERHGGSITAVSEGRGRGTTFTIKLPGAHLKNDVAAEPPAHDAAAI